MSIKTQGTHIYVKNVVGTEYTLVKFDCPTGVTGLGGGGQDEIDTTCLDAETKSFVLGLKDGGEASVPFIYDDSNLSHRSIFRMVGLNTEIIVCFSNGSSAPTLNTSDMIVAPTGRTSVKFAAALKQIPLDFAANEVVRATMPLRVSGDKTITFKNGESVVY